MIARIRKGNDFKHIWPITWNGQPEDFSDATDITLTATVYGQVKTLTEGVDYHIDGGMVMIDFTPTICDITGTYTVELNYIKPSAEFIDGDRRSAVDVQAFQIVNTSAESNATEGVSLPSEAMAAYALKYDDLTEAQKDELRGKGITSIDLTGEVGDTKTYTITYGDGLTFDFSVTDGHTPIFTFAGTVLYIDGVAGPDLKGETGNGIASVELTSTVGLVKTYTITFTDATTTTFTVTNGSTPEITFQGTTIYVDGVSGPDLKGEAGRGITSVELLSTVGLAKTYRITFTDATTYDYVVTDGAAGTGATVVQTTGGSLVDVMSQKAVTDELGQLAGEMNQNSNLETTSKNIVGAINEVNRIVSIHHADNRAVRRWNNTLSTPLGEAVGDLDFLRELPRILGLGCYLVDDDLTKRKLHRDNHNFYEDGTPAMLDGTEGQYMFCWGAFYFTTWEEGDYTYEAVSLQPIIGKKSYYIPAGGYSAIGHGVIDRTNLTLCSVVNSDPRYRGGGNVALTGTLAGE